MPEQIDDNKIFSNNFLEKTLEKFRELLKLIRGVEEEMKDVLKVQLELIKASDKKSIAGLEKRKKAITSVNQVSKEMLKLEKQRIDISQKIGVKEAKLAQEKQKTTQQQLRTAQQRVKLNKELANSEKSLLQVVQQEKKAVQQGLKVQQDELRIKKQKLTIEIQEKKELKRLDAIKQKEIATSKRVAAATEKENSEYFKQSRTLNNLRKKYKDLILVQGKETRATRKLRKEITQLDTKLKKVDASVGQFQRSVGNYGKAFGKVSGALRSVGLAIGGLAIIRNIGNIFTGFQQESANLASVLGKTRKEITGLTDDAKRLGGITSFTAKDVLKLQTSFAKLGFKEQEILDATEATLSLAAATGTDLAEAASIAGSTLGGFGLEADETQRVVDVMAKSFSTSALDMESFKEAMKGAAPAARAVGITVEKTTALLGTLANAGIRGSKAGNNLKTSLIKLNAAGLTLDEGLAKVAASSDKLATASELVGLNAAASFLVLAEGKETTDELTKGLNNAGGAAEKMANEQLDTLTGRTKLMTSAWEGFILSLEDGEGVFAQVANTVVEGITNMLNHMAKLGQSAEQLRKGVTSAREAIGSEGATKRLQRQFELFEKSNESLEKIVKNRKDGFNLAKRELEFRKLELTETQKVISIQGFLAVNQKKKVDKLKEELELRRKQGIFLGNEALQREIDTEEGLRLGSKEIALSRIKVATEKELLELADRNKDIGEFGLKQRVAIARLADKELQRRKDIGEVIVETGNTSDSNRTKELTGLEKIRSELSKIMKLRSDELVANGDTTRFNQLSRESKELQDQIEFLEARLKLESEGFTAKKRDIVTDISEITGEEDAREQANKDVDDFVEIQVEGAEEVAENEKQFLEDRLNALKNFAQQAIEITDAKTDKEIENIDKELEASKNREQQLQEIAAKGNLAADQSVSTEIKRQVELERQKAELEKKKARRQIILEGLDLLSSKIDAGEKDAVTSTLNDMTRLLSALAFLPGFIDGTETTVGAALGTPHLNTGTDDYVIRVDGKEKILNPSLSAKTGGATTTQIVDGFLRDQAYVPNMNELISPQLASLHSSYQDSTQIMKGFNSLKKAIEDKPILSDLHFNDLEKVFTITTEKSGNLYKTHYDLK